jgi:beta-glucanase (GH16 family)
MGAGIGQSRRSCEMSVRRRRALAAIGVLVLGFTAVIALLTTRDGPVERIGRPIALSLVTNALEGCRGVPAIPWPGGTWRCRFSEDFDGPAVDLTKWVVMDSARIGFHSGDACFVDDPANVSVAQGRLYLTARATGPRPRCGVPSDGKPIRYTSGMVTSMGRFDQTYGRFEIRARFTGVKVAGVQGSIWLWPSRYPYGAWPRSGEIDIAEFYSRFPDRVIPYVHYASSGKDPSVTNRQCLVQRPDRFHTYAAQWTRDAITITFDGKVCVSTRWSQAAPLQKPAPFDHPFYVNLTQALGIGNNAFDPRTTPLPAAMQVDHVYVWG